MLSKKNHIIMIQDFFGINLTYQENLLSEYYVKMGCSVTIICSTYENVKDYIANRYDSNKVRSEFVHQDVKVIRLPYHINFVNKIKFYQGVYDILVAESPDLIYVHDIHLNLIDVVKYRKKYKQVKVIMDYHADFKNSAKNWISLNVLHKIVRKSVLNYSIKYIDKIYAVGPSCIDFLSEVYGLNKNRIELLPLGCDYEKSCQIMLNANVKELREQYNILEQDFVIITGGKFNPNKKTELVIDAVLKMNNPKVHLLIFGSAEYGHELYAENLIKIAKQSNNIHLLGHLSASEMLIYMSISDLAVFPSSQSAIWQQTIGMHLPIIIGGEKYEHISYLNRNSNAFILEENKVNVEHIILYIKQLIEDPMLLATMKQGAEQTAKTFLDYRMIAEQSLEVLK